MSTHDSTINRDSQAYWNKRATTFTRDATGDYERWLLDLLALEAGEEVLDMGCATGTLAVPPRPGRAPRPRRRLCRGLDRRGADAHVQVILEKRLELDPEQAPLGQERAVLFHLSDELADRPALGDHHGLAEEGAAFGAADQEVHVRVGDGAGASDQVAGALAVLVGAISADLFHVGGDKGVEHPGVRTLLVIAGKVRQRIG